jgi:hypothetical protein
MNRNTKLLGVVLLLVAAAATSQTTTAADDPRPAAAVKNIDLVICLDVSNSMDGLISSAKAKLWDIVNELARIKPAPNLRVALYSYGNDGYDPKVGWVKKDLDLSGDLDMLYQKLFALTTRGGTEYVTRVCRDAVRDLRWSSDKNALKIIFVCGNEPASQDPVVKLKEAADFAIGNGVVINPIYCGNPDDADARDWRQFASLAGGRFATIDQNRATVAIATPMDKKLAELGVQLNATYIAYGKGGDTKSKNQAAQTANAFKAGAGVAASRTAAQNSAIYQCQDWDLVDRCKMDKKFDVTKLPESELPDAMKKLTPAERVTYVKDMTAKRAGLQKQITEVNAQRVLFINEALKRNPSQANRAFDAAIRATLQEQAAGRGIVIPKE